MEKSSSYDVTVLSGGSCLIKLPAEVLGGNDALEFSSLLGQVIKDGAKKIYADLSATVIMNSSGLGMLVGGLTTCRKNNTEFYLYNAGAKIMSLLEMTKLHKVFAIAHEIDETENR